MTARFLLANVSEAILVFSLVKNRKFLLIQENISTSVNKIIDSDTIRDR